MANRKGQGRGGVRSNTRSDSGAKKIVAIAVLLLVIAALAVGTLLCGYAARDPYTGKWFKNADIASWTLKDNSPKDYMSIQTYSLSVDEFEAYGITEDAIAAKSYSVVFTPKHASNKRIVWNIRWSGKKSAWSANKQLSDYVDFKAGADYAPTATLALKQSFGDTIILEAVSQGNTKIKSSIEIDYVARVDAFSGGETTVEYDTNINLLEDLSTEEFYNGSSNYSVIPDSFVITNAIITIPKEVSSESDTSEVSSITEIDPDFNARTGLISFDRIIGYYTATGIAAYLAKYDTSYFGTVTATITCYYKNEEIYSFTAQSDLWFTDECIEQLSTPVTNITITPGWSAFKNEVKWKEENAQPCM